MKTMEQTVEAHHQLAPSSPLEPVKTSQPLHHAAGAGATGENLADRELAGRLDGYSLEAIVEVKISRFLEQIGTYYPENMYDMIMKKVERPLLKQILQRTGGNQVHAARILGINRNTLRKKMKSFGF